MRILSICLFAGLSAAAAWAGAADETDMALKHAYLAAQADKIAEVHANLHRTVNCLVGPKDTLFDSKELNPCAKTGNGAIADTADAAKKKHLQDAVEMAERGIVSTDLTQAIMLAMGAVTAIKSSQGSTAGRP